MHMVAADNDGMLITQRQCDVIDPHPEHLLLGDIRSYSTTKLVSIINQSLFVTGIIYRVFHNDCTLPTAETNKTLAKLLLYYSSLNKVTLLCRVSD